MTSPSPPSPDSGDDLSQLSEKVVEYVSYRAAQLVDQRIHQREERRRRLQTTVLTVLAIVGVGSLYTLMQSEVRKEVNDVWAEAELDLEGEIREQIATNAEVVKLQVIQDLDNQLRALQREITDDRLQLNNRANTIERDIRLDLTENITEVRTEITQARDLQEFSLLATRLETQGFTAVNRDAVMALLRILPVEIAASQPFFLADLQRVINVFTQADLVEDLLEIDSRFHGPLSRSQETAVLMTDYLGVRLVGSPFESSELPRLTARLNSYLSAARGNDYPETALFWQVLLAVKESGDQELVHELIRDAVTLEEQDRVGFLERLRRFADCSSWTTTDSCPRIGERIQDLTNELARSEAEALAMGMEPLCMEVESAEGSERDKTVLFCARHGWLGSSGLLRVGESAEGVLEESDSKILDGRWIDIWELEIPNDGEVTVDVQSRAFDPILTVHNLAITDVEQDDDSGQGCNARLTISVAVGSQLRIFVNSVGRTVRGPYTISVTPGRSAIEPGGCQASI